MTAPRPSGPGPTEGAKWVPIVFQEGKPVKHIVGAKGKAELLSDLADYLG